MGSKKGGSAKAARRKLRKKMGAITARRKREFTYRGYTLQQMLQMSLDEILKLLPARARRTYKRGIPEEHRGFVESLRNGNTNEVVRTHCRDLPILPQFVGRRVAVHNGRNFIEFEIKPEMIGHYLGEFAMTRKPVRHSGPGVGATRSSKFLPLK